MRLTFLPTPSVLAILTILLMLCFQPHLHGEGPAGAFKTLPGFEVELVHEVDPANEGSWVALCVDDKNRILASDQYGKLYRVTVGAETQVEQLEANIGMAQGMLYAFDSLYININAQRKNLQGTDAQGPGVYRLQDTTGDDQFDKIEYIVPMSDKAGEHGPHALILSPDKQQIYFCSGNQVDVPEKATTGPVPRLWDEDHLLGRMPDARGHMRGRLAPGGWICRMDPDGSNIDLMATGFRNEYDIAFNKFGDLFTYDADMEWDIGSPWYRPTRVNHVISGAEFGWRNGTGKWPAYYGDSFGAVVNIGPGSPTGIAFGYGTQFPAKYQEALFIADWSYGAIHAVHMTAEGASYQGEYETFLTAAPMAVTDMIVHPDGNLYFAVGGRKTDSALYRVRYAAAEDTTEVAAPDAQTVAAQNIRKQLELFHGKQDPASVALAISHLGNPDRAIRFAARVALEHQPVAQWREAALRVDEPLAVITSAYALARTGSKEDQAQLFEKLSGIEFGKQPLGTQLELLRALQLVALRLGAPNAEQQAAILTQIDHYFPNPEGLLNRELASMLVYLDAPNVVGRVVEQLGTASAQEDQIHFAFALRDQKEGWDPKSRKAYFQWFFDVASARGGASFGGFLTNIRQAALDNLSEAERQSLGALAGDMPAPADPLADLAPREHVAKWDGETLQKALAEIDVLPDFERGRMLTATAQCFKCHRFAGQGGIQGPDLTAAGQRFNRKNMLTAILDPSKEVSDQYQATQFLTEDDKIITGRVANLSGKQLRIVTNMFAPGDFTSVNVDEIVQRTPSKTSMMPSGLLDTFTAEEITQMLAYLQSGGKPSHDVYSQKEE